MVAKELGVFEENEYNFTRDLKSAYRRSLKSSTEAKIFDTIPDHYFWDIKAPQMHKDVVRKNRYNPFRGREFSDFFEMRGSERYMQRIHMKTNLNDSTSIYRRY